ncbi:ABC transporter permease [Occultella kanbiaonis]|uniref:ABC transporter permease n=1 Tax=Occultella kanbiaonis TaxID=2675754 RepID=UPI003F49477B
MALTVDDIDEVADIDGVLRVQPALNVSVDFIQHGDGTRYQLALSQIMPGVSVELAAGDQVDLQGDQPQIVLPNTYLEPLGLGPAQDAIGQNVVLAVTDASGTQTTTEVTVVGIAEPGLISMAGAIPNEALTTALFDLQMTGAAQGQAETYASASVWFEPDAGDEATDAFRERLADAGYTATTLEDQLGTFTSVIDTIVLVLNGFAIIALLAASIGIINTPLHGRPGTHPRDRPHEGHGGVQREGVIAVHHRSRRHRPARQRHRRTGCFRRRRGSLSCPASSILSDLPGLTLILFEPATVATVILSVMAVAFLAGTMPALRTARQDPIEPLRFE